MVFHGELDPISLAAIFGAFLVYLILSRVVLPWYIRRSARYRRSILRIGLRSLQRLMFIWFLLAEIAIFLYFYIKGSSYDVYFTNAINSVLVVFFITIGYLLTLFVDEAVSFYVRKGRVPAGSLFNSVAKLFVWLLLVSFLLSFFGISLVPFFATLGIGGLAVALALQDTLSNFFSGMYIVLSKQLNPGDFVVLQSGEEGFIHDIGWRTTSIRDFDNNIIIIPNNNFSQMVVRNFNLPTTEMSLRFELGIDYSSDLEHVERVTFEVAKKVVEIIGGVPEMEPIVNFLSFADSSINLFIRIRLKSVDQRGKARSLLIKELHKRYREEGINIPFPIRTVHMKQK